MKRSLLWERLTKLALALVYCGVAGLAAAEQAYLEEGATACIDCHATPEVMSIRETAHAKAEDPNTPAAQKECQSCHGPSATHVRFPMQVANLHFGAGSKTLPEVQNKMCLECHENGSREHWHASAHGFEKVVCSTCHSVHDADEIVPAKATVSSGCSSEGCHVDLMAGADPGEFSHALGRKLGDEGELTCVGCHNPHGPLSSDRCSECHDQTPEVRALESAKAQRFHAVAEKKGTECMRCHKGIAHPIPPLALQQMQDEMRALSGE